MRKQATITAVTVALLRALTGCGEAVDATPESAPGASVPAKVVETVEPLTAETAAPLVAEVASDEDAEFIQQLTTKGAKLQTIPNASEEQLVAAARQACDELANGVDRMDIRLIEGEAPDDAGWYRDSLTISTIAAAVYCPEFSG